MTKIRRFSEGDSESVQSLINRIMSSEYGDAVKAYPTDDIEQVSKFYGALGEAFFVAVDGAQVVGTVAIKKEDDRQALLRRLFVAPECRGKRLGEKLLDEALKFCKDVGYDEVVFKTTSKMQGAIKVCQKRGFTQRARLNLGPIELCKFSLSIRNGFKLSNES